MLHFGFSLSFASGPFRQNKAVGNICFGTNIKGKIRD
jgi:nicotinamide mononucleotide (NMN) deamidase PncC